MARIRSLVVYFLLLAGAMASAQQAAPAQTEAEQTRAIYLKGKTEYDLGNYDGAVKYFEDVYRRKPLPALLFNIAQCYRFVGNLDKAATSFRAFLRNAPADNANIPQAKALLAEVEKSIAQREKLNAAHPQGLAGGVPSAGGLATTSAAPATLAPPASATLSPPASAALSPPATPPNPPASGSSPAAAPSSTTSTASTTLLAPIPPAAPAKLAVVQQATPAPAVIQAPLSATDSTIPPSTEKSHRSHIATWVVGGVGLVALGAGGYFGLQSKSLMSNLQGSEHPQSQIDSDYASAQSDASKGNILMIGGAVLVAAAGVLFLIGY